MAEAKPTVHPKHTRRRYVKEGAAEEEKESGRYKARDFLNSMVDYSENRLAEAEARRRRAEAEKDARRAEKELEELDRGEKDEGEKAESPQGGDVVPPRSAKKRYTIIDGEPVEDEEGEYTLAQAKKKIAEDKKERRKWRLSTDNQLIEDRENGDLTLNEALALQESRRKNAPSGPKKRFRLDENDNPVLDEEEGNLTLAEAETLSRVRKRGNQGSQGDQNPVVQALQAIGDYEQKRGGNEQGMTREELNSKLELQKKEMEELAQGLVAQSTSRQGNLSDEISKMWNMLPDDWKEGLKRKLLGGGGALSLTDNEGKPLQLTPDMLPSLIELDKFREEQKTKRERNSVLQDLVGAARQYGGIVLNIFQNLMTGGKTEQGLEGEWASFGEAGSGSTQGTGRGEEEIKQEVINDLGVAQTKCFNCGQPNIVAGDWIGFRCQGCGQVNIRQDIAEQWRSQESTSSEQSEQQEGETREVEPSSQG